MHVFNENVWISIKQNSRKFVPKVHLTIFQHHYLNRWWLFCWRIYASPGLNELRKSGKPSVWLVFLKAKIEGDHFNVTFSNKKFNPFLLITKRSFSRSRSKTRNGHYNDVIMGAIASQITSLTIIFSAIYLDTDKKKHQSSASLAFVRGIHRGPVNSPYNWPVTRKMFPLDDVIMT